MIANSKTEYTKRKGKVMAKSTLDWADVCSKVVKMLQHLDMNNEAEEAEKVFEAVEDKPKARFEALRPYVVEIKAKSKVLPEAAIIPEGPTRPDVKDEQWCGNLRKLFEVVATMSAFVLKGESADAGKPAPSPVPKPQKEPEANIINNEPDSPTANGKDDRNRQNKIRRALFLSHRVTESNLVEEFEKRDCFVSISHREWDELPSDQLLQKVDQLDQLAHESNLAVSRDKAKQLCDLVRQSSLSVLQQCWPNKSVEELRKLQNKEETKSGAFQTDDFKPQLVDGLIEFLEEARAARKPQPSPAAGAVVPPKGGSPTPQPQPIQPQPTRSGEEPPALERITIVMKMRSLVMKMRSLLRSLGRWGSWTTSTVLLLILLISWGWLWFNWPKAKPTTQTTPADASSEQKQDESVPERELKPFDLKKATPKPFEPIIRKGNSGESATQTTPENSKTEKGK